MASNMMAPIRMASNFDASYTHTVIYQADNADAVVEDGALVVLGDFAKDPVYSTAYTAGAGADTTVIDINTRYATAPAEATASGVCVIDLANVPTAVSGTNEYRIGTDVIGLTNGAGHWSRARELRVNDTLHIGADNIEGEAEAVVGQFVTPTAGKTTWTPAAAAPGAGFYAKVVKKEEVTRGVSNPFTRYMLVVMAN